MDPSIMHLLEGDEDETMHTSAEVEAFAAALNMDIDGDTSSSQPPDSEISVLSQGNGYTSNQFLPQWNPSTHMENASSTMQQIQTERMTSESGLQQQEAVIHSQKALDDVSLELHPFPPEKKTFQGDSCQIQSRQNAPHLSQLAADSGNVPVHNLGSDRTNSEDHEAQLMKLQNMNSQPAAMSRMVNQQILTTAGGTSNKQPILPGASSQQALISGNINQLASGPSLYGKQLPIGVLLPIILPQLDKDKVRQLVAIYNKLRRNEISRNDFVRHMRSFVGDQTLKMALYKLLPQTARNAHNMPQLSAHSPAPAQQWQSSTASDGNTNAGKPRDIERVPGAQVAISVYGSSASNHQPFLGQNAYASASPPELGPHGSQRRHILAYQNTSAISPLGMTSQGMNVANMPKFDSLNLINDPKKWQGSSPHMTNSSSLPQNAVQWQSSSSNEQKSGTSSSMSYEKQQLFELPHVYAPYGSSVLAPSSSVHAAQGNPIPGTSNEEMHYSRAGFSTGALTYNISTSTIYSQTDTTNMRQTAVCSSEMEESNSRETPAAPLVALVNNAKASSKKPTGGQKKPLEVLGSSPPSSKKPTGGQKKPLEVLGSSPPPSSKKQKVSEALMDQSIEQLNDVTAVGGVNLLEEDEQLFSIPKEDSHVSASRKVVQEEEERLILEKVPFQIKLAEIVAKSGLKGISNDVERCLSLCVEERFRGLIGNLIKVSKHRLDNDKLRHKTVVTSDVGQQIMLLNGKARAEWEVKQAEAEKLQKLNEANKEVEDMMRTTAANAAARAAVGGDDMLSKWKLMAEQARHNRQGDASSTSLPERELPSSISLIKYNQQVHKKVQSTGVAKKVGKSGAVVPHPKAVGCIAVKDVIAVLEREPQMSRPALIYRLYEKIHTEAVEGKV